MNVALYVRVSHDEQVMKGYSLDAQEKALLDFTEEKGYKVMGIYRDEGFSAKKSAFTRPAMQRLLADLNKIDLILFIKLDRWFRNIKEYYRIQEQLEKHNVSWKAILEDYDTSTADGRLKVNIMLSVAENEADRTSERIRFVFQNKIAKGEVINNTIPFGYKVVDKKLVKNEDAHLVDEMFRYYLTYQNYTQLADHMADLGCNFPMFTWRARIRNKIYTGEYKGNPDFCEPYITKEEYETILGIAKRNIKESPTHRIYLFTGLIKCPECGRNLSSAYSSKITPVHSYRCPSRLEHRCDFVGGINEKKLEKYLIDHIEEKYAIHEEFMLSQKQKKSERGKYESKLKRLNTIYLNGNMDEDEYKKKSKEIKAQIEEEKKIETVDTAKIKETKQLLKGFKEAYEGLSKESKRAFWRGIIKEICIDKDKNVTDIIFID